MPAQFGTPAQTQQTTAADQQVREAQDNLRRLYSQGEYERVLEEADALLARDPGNSSATMLRALAERRIARGDTLPSGPDAPRTRGGAVDRSAIQEATEALIEPPPPLEPRRATGRTAAFNDLLTQYRQEIIIGGAVLLALLILLFLWLWKRSRDEAVPAAATTSGNVPLSDMPTQVHRSSAEQKPVAAVPRKKVRRKPVKAKQEEREERVVEEPPGISEEDDPDKTLQVAPPPPPSKEEKREREVPAAPPPSDSLVLDDYHNGEEEEKQPEIGSSLGIDYSETEDLKPEGISAFDEEKTFNSLMFGEDTEVKQPKEPKDPKEELSKSQFDDEFANMMFGEGSEDTVLTPPPGKEASGGDEEEQTLLTPPPAKPEKKDEKGAGKVSMFDRQRQTGEEALKEGDYGRAVQCLSVAASLRPGDKEVRALLEEARKKKRGG